ncbi:MAG: histidine--tRNA ligase, partial [Chloroflexota bacterium]|nr:histidine--tRNA ligase [Chloroflexota bacterium]
VGLTDAVVRVNSIGDGECRPAYRDALIGYFSAHEERLSEDSRRRLRVNPLRVLDDKALPKDLAADAPRGIDHLCDACREHFDAVRGLLDQLGVPYELDHRLVRGLDYYTRTAFEFYVSGREGQQQALGGGGRYDGLVELLGGRATPGIGFGIGLDRTILAMEAQGITLPLRAPLVAILGTGNDHVRRLQIAATLREAGVAVRPDGSSRKLGKQLESAAKAGARWAVIIGEGEALALKDLASGEQRDAVSVEELAMAVSE